MIFFCSFFLLCFSPDAQQSAVSHRQTIMDPQAVTMVNFLCGREELLSS